MHWCSEVLLPQIRRISICGRRVIALLRMCSATCMVQEWDEGFEESLTAPEPQPGCAALGTRAASTGAKAQAECATTYSDDGLLREPSSCSGYIERQRARCSSIAIDGMVSELSGSARLLHAASPSKTGQAEHEQPCTADSGHSANGRDGATGSTPLGALDLSSDPLGRSILQREVRCMHAVHSSSAYAA